MLLWHGEDLENETHTQGCLNEANQHIIALVMRYTISVSVCVCVLDGWVDGWGNGEFHSMVL